MYTDRIFYEMELPERYNGMTLLFEGPFVDDCVTYYNVYYSLGANIVWIGRASRLPLSFDEFRNHNKELSKMFP